MNGGTGSGSGPRKHPRGGSGNTVYRGVRSSGSNRDRLVFMQLNLVGRKVEVKKQNGLTLEGLFVGAAAAASAASWDGCVVQYAKVTHVPPGVVAPRFDPTQRLKLKWKDVAYIHAKGAGGASMMEGERKTGFRTDTDISAKSVKAGKLRGRQLEAADSAWLTAQAPKSVSDSKKDNGVWDQFKENKERFGVKSTYDENLYTTPLQKSTLTPEQIRRAEETARDIEKQSTNNPHMREERGQGAWGGDEESRFSSVRRKEETKPKLKSKQNAKHAKNDRPSSAGIANKTYTPPHLRASSTSPATQPNASGQPPAKSNSAKPQPPTQPAKEPAKAWGGNRSFAAVLTGNDKAKDKLQQESKPDNAKAAKPSGAATQASQAVVASKGKEKAVAPAPGTGKSVAQQGHASKGNANAAGRGGQVKAAGGRPNGRAGNVSTGGAVAPRVNTGALASIHSGDSSSGSSPKKDSRKMAAIKAQQIAEFHKFSSELESKGKAKQRAEEKGESKKEVKAKSKLNVAAKEWVPSASAKEFRPRGVEQPPPIAHGAVPMGMPMYQPVVVPQPPMQAVMYSPGMYPQPSMGMQYYQAMPMPNVGIPPGPMMYNPPGIPPGAGVAPPFDPNIPQALRPDPNQPRPPPPPQDHHKK